MNVEAQMTIQDRSPSRVSRAFIGIALAIMSLAGSSLFLIGANSDGVLAVDMGRIVDVSGIGDLDPIFGIGGVVTTAISGDDRGRSVVIQPDGKIVVAGQSGEFLNSDFAVIRYTISGTLDTAFGSGGIVTTSIGSSSNDICYAVALQPDGKIVAAGGSSEGANNVLVLVRYNGNGSLDTDFGSGGIVTASVSGNATGLSVAVQTGGKIVVSGSSWNSSSFDADFAVARYTITGTLDTTFGASGFVTTPIGSSSMDNGHSVALQSDGKIVVGGDGSGVFAVVRYNTDGSLDSAFGLNGIVTTSFGNYAGAVSVAIQPDGKIVAVGQSGSSGDWDISVARYTITGTLDLGFGTAGVVVTPIGSSADYGSAVAVQSDGKIVVAGGSSNGNDDDFAVVRYSPTGALDTLFGVGGIVVTPIGLGDDSGFSVALQSDGKIVVAGSSYGHTDNDFAIVRYLASSLTEFVYLPIVQR
jgi:uncharacterized delta-60 repeat protein